MSSPISRRQFIGTSLKMGAGAAALGVIGFGGEAEASPLGRFSPLTEPTPSPEKVQRFVSRPDITPPGVRIDRSGELDVAAQPSYIFLAPRVVAGSGQTGGTQGLMMVDLNGDLVWWRPSTNHDAVPFNFRVQTYGGKPVLTWFEGEVAEGYAIHGTGKIADATYTPFAEVKADGFGTDLHEFLITPEDTAFVTAYEYAAPLLIGHAQEIAIGPNTVEWDWRCYPTIPTSASYVSPKVSPDYFHINSIDLWPGPERNVLISARNTSTIYLISRATKEVIWSLGGKSSSFAQGPGAHFTTQHDARPLADGSGLSLFDDASAPSPEKQSWGKVLTLDQKARTATLRHQFSHSNQAIDSGHEGNVQLLPTNGHFIGWGAYPFFSLYGASNTVTAPLLLDGRMPTGIQNYRAFLSDWTGAPPERELAIVVHGGDGVGKYTAWVSWNGATEVAYWEVAAGRSTALKAVAIVARHGFETRIPFVLDGATDFQVTALDSKKRVLGNSQVVHVS